MKLLPPIGEIGRPDGVATDRLSVRPPLRFFTCGSVDDGKSTLIGRLLYENNLLFDDQLRAVEQDSMKYGTAGEDVDFALLLDGLEGEREQGITIDVAYRYFATRKRSFVVADTPGHEQYTRNMVTGASNASLAIILVDARKGLLPQTFRHSTIVSLIGIRHVVLAINKCDLIGFDPVVVDAIRSQFIEFTSSFGFHSSLELPISARCGDNISSKSNRTPWYHGPCLLEHLETIEVDEDADRMPFRMAVQLVLRKDGEFRGFCGSIASGRLRPGDEIVVAGSGRSVKVERIIAAGGDRAIARTADAVTLCLTPHTDIARGDLLVAQKHRAELSDQFAAYLIWMSEDALLPGRSYLMKIGNRTLPATVTELKYKLDVTSRAKLAAKTLGVNEIGFCNIAAASAVTFDPYSENRETGSFILIDRFTKATLAAGLIAFGLRRATNTHRQHVTLRKHARAQIKHQRPAIIWLTGLSGAGKSTIANLVEVRLHRRGVHTVMLDGDNVRHGLNKDLGFTEADRVENIRRVGEVAKLMVDAGLIVLCSFISPFRAERRMVRELVEVGEFIEVFVDTPLEECIARDPKGLYKKAMTGHIQNFTGITQEYEEPENAEIHLSAGRQTPEASASEVIEELVRRGICEMDLADPFGSSGRV
jgi:bifunctional enzyme CysN/CysC